jgi:hypothetical protein
VSRRDPAAVQTAVVEPRRDTDQQRARDTAASVDSDAVTRLAGSAPAPRSGQGRPPVHVAIDPELYAAFTAKLGQVGLSKRVVVEQLIAGWVA